MKIPNWYVLTGAPHSGKTTVLQALSKKGFMTVEETARLYIDREIKKGKTIAQIRKNERTFQRKLLEMKIQITKNISKDKIVFFDRGIHDTMAYFMAEGIYYDKVLAKAMIHTKYRKIFMFEPLPFTTDYARNETPEKAKKLHELLYTSYERLNTPILNVPVMPVEERTQFILNNLG